MNDIRFDVLVAGTGIAGCIAATLLARAGWSVVLIGKPQSVIETGETLPSLARPLLQAVGLWEEFLQTQPLLLRESKSEWGHRVSERLGIFSPYGEGWIIHKEQWLDVMRATAQKAGVCLISDVKVADVIQLVSEQSNFRVLLSDDRPIYTQALVDATGRHAQIARQLGARRIVWDRLAAAFWRIQGEMAIHGRTTINSHKQGWWYSATLPTGGVGLTTFYYPRAQVIKKPLSLPWQFLPLEISAMLGDIHLDARPQKLSAASAYVFPVAGKHWAAIGDAACAFDPLAATGLLNAMRTAVRAAHAIGDDLFGEPSALYNYNMMVGGLINAYGQSRSKVYAQALNGFQHHFWETATNSWYHGTVNSLRV